jgi:hypothetical protein
MADHYEFEIRFQEVGVEDGKVDAERLGRLALSLQGLSLRLGRAITGASGVGRSTDEVKQETRLVFSGTERGSTRLIFEGPKVEPELPLSPPVAGLSEQVMRELSPVLRGDAGQWRSSRTVIESATEFLDALADVDAVELTTRPPEGEAQIDPVDVAAASRELRALLATSAELDAEDAAVVGELYMVDAHNGHFKVQGDVGPVVDVYVGDDVDRSARLVTARVRATGSGVRDMGGRVTRLDGATMAALESDDPYGFSEPVDLDSLRGRAVPFDAATTGISDLDDAEIDEFLHSIGK